MPAIQSQPKDNALEYFEERIHDVRRAERTLDKVHGGLKRMKRQLTVDLGVALREIRDQELWRQRAAYATFADYCEGEYSYDKSEVSRYIAFGCEADALAIANIGQHRALERLGNDLAAKIEATELARDRNGGDLSGPVLSLVVDEIVARATPSKFGSREELMTPVADLKTHPLRVWKAATDVLEESMRAVGVASPLVAQEDGTVLSGNARLEIARKLGWEKVPVVRTTLQGEDALAFMVADNRLASMGGVDDILWYELVERDDAEQVKATTKKHGIDKVKGWAVEAHRGQSAAESEA